ncbi:MAG: hypothetical protein ACI4OM_02855 [Evtepia sp.]
MSTCIPAYKKTIDTRKETQEKNETNHKLAAGPFGAKNGAIADLGDGCTPKTLLNQYKEDGNDIEAYFFVATFTVTADQLAEAKQILGSLYYDDSAVVYLNSGKVASFDEPEGGFTQNMEYGGSNASAPKLGEFTRTDVSALQEGTNVLAVEIHQGRADSSDIYFDFQSLALSTEEPDYSSLPLEQDTAALSVGGTETEMNFTWYASTEEAGMPMPPLPPWQTASCRKTPPPQPPWPPFLTGAATTATS